MVETVVRVLVERVHRALPPSQYFSTSTRSQALDRILAELAKSNGHTAELLAQAKREYNQVLHACGHLEQHLRHTAPEERDRAIAEKLPELIETYPDYVVALAVDEYRWRLANTRTLQIPPTLADPDSENASNAWYTGPQPGDRYWPALKKRLQERGLDSDTIDSIDAASTKIVSYLESPVRASFQTRGLVIGYVQSGKTTNYSAVISKAADAGYKLFVILAGMTDKLRGQAQTRLQKDLIDTNSAHWFTLTTCDLEADGARISGDFVGQRIRAEALLARGTPTIAIVKKNSPRLKRLIRWLGGMASGDTKITTRPEVLQASPMLLIDDEADQASPNTARGLNRRTAINNRICELLALMPKAAYVGYTATPFANILADPQDAPGIYPRDFITCLEKPAGYMGAEDIFGRERLYFDDPEADIEGIDAVNIVPEQEVDLLRGRGNGTRTPAQSRSLQDSLLYFLMAAAARLVRGQVDAPSTMLIHTSMAVAVQQSFADPVGKLVKKTARELETGEASLRQRMEQIWNEELRAVPAEDFDRSAVSFAELQKHLTEVAKKCTVIVENHMTPQQDRLVYEPGKWGALVVIGGNILSRGLTLEGLLVSLFVRTSSYYDALLQMGRWFGYRPGYEDLPRMWMTDELKTWFSRLAVVEAEIRRDFRRYETDRKTPLEWGARIRTYPGMMVTERSKMRSGKTIRVSYSASRPQTILFYHKDPSVLAANLAAACSLARNLCAEKPFQKSAGNFFFTGVSPAPVLQFLSDYQCHPENFEAVADLLRQYIRRENQQGRLNVWNVVVLGLDRKREDLGSYDFGSGVLVNLVSRTKLSSSPDGTANIKALLSRTDSMIDLVQQGLISGKDAEDLSADTDKARNIYSERTRLAGQTGLLLVYPISRNSTPEVRKTARKLPNDPRVTLDADDHLIGFVMVFPNSPTLDGQEYIIPVLPQANLAEMQAADEEADQLLEQQDRSDEDEAASRESPRI